MEHSQPKRRSAQHARHAHATSASQEKATSSQMSEASHESAQTPASSLHRLPESRRAGASRDGVVPMQPAREAMPMQPARRSPSRRRSDPAQGGSSFSARAAARKITPQRGKRSKSFYVGISVLAVLICVCLVAIGVIQWGYIQGNRNYDALAKEALPAESIMEETPLDTKIDWDALCAVNPETIAWVYVPGTSINYPVVQTSNNEKYIKTDFQGETNWAVSYGAIFLDADCESDMTSQNSFFYGHNMNNGAMFAPLASLAENDAFNDCRTVYLFTPERNYELQSFAFLHVAANDDVVQPTTGSVVHQRAYVQTQMDRSIAVPEEGFPDAGSVGHTFAFATCDNLPSNGRYVLFCRAVETK